MIWGRIPDKPESFTIRLINLQSSEIIKNKIFIEAEYTRIGSRLMQRKPTILNLFCPYNQMANKWPNTHKIKWYTR
jgi:hypothetical protein